MVFRLLKIPYTVFIDQLRARLRRGQFIVLVAVLTGLVAGLLAVSLKLIVHRFQVWVSEMSFFRVLYMTLPLAALLLTVFIVRRFFHGQIERGIAMVLRAIGYKSAYIPLSHTYLHVITSSLTVGLGGSVGLEAPIVATGAATGSNLARISALNYQERTLLISCGAAAGIAAVFNAPIAGVIFAIEVLMIEASVAYFIPLMIASVIGALCSKIILQESFLFNFVLQQKFNYANVPFYILLGLLTGMLSLYYARVFTGTERLFKNLRVGAYAKALIGGTFLILIYLLFPPLFGEGYGTISRLATGLPAVIEQDNIVFGKMGSGLVFALFIALVALLKPVAAAVTVGGGGNGGNFAPSLFVGANIGFFLSRILNLSGWFRIPEGNFTLVGMAGVLSGVMYCPLTAIFLIAEITNGYELFIPLMIVSSISYFLVRHKAPYSMEAKKLYANGQTPSRRKEQHILASVRFEDLMGDRYETIGEDKTLGDLVELVKKSDQNIYAVVNARNQLKGTVELNDIKHQIVQPGLFNRIMVARIMKPPADVVTMGEPIEKVMVKFDLTRSWYLPVIDQEKRFIGFISKAKLFNRYRELLVTDEAMF